MSLTKNQYHEVIEAARLEKYSHDADYEKFMSEYAEQNDLSTEDVFGEYQ